MTQEEKQLLLKDLCMIIPYRTFVCLNPGAYNKPETCILTGVHGEKVHLNVDSDPFRINNIKPYLRPMSSMTDGERRFLLKFGTVGMDENDKVFDVYPFGMKRTMPVIDFLSAHHFDYRGLIEKGLALEAPEGMYKTE